MKHSRPSFLILAPWLHTLVVSSEPILPRQGNPQNVWVTIDASGSARTITPSVSASKTVSGAPEYVTDISVYTLTTASGLVQTSTGMAPVATATANSGAGAFVACSNYQGWDEPFCLPRRGSVLRPGVSYYGEYTSVILSHCAKQNLLTNTSDMGSLLLRLGVYTSLHSSSLLR